MLTEKLDLRRLAKLAGVHRKEGTPFVSVTPDEIDSLIARIRSLESRASNAGGAVAFDPWFNEQIKSGNLLSYEDAKAGWDGFAETQTTVTGGTVNLDLTGLSIHPAPASKEPVADERAMVRGVPKSIINAITAYGDARADSKDTGEAIGNAVSAIRAALATAQTWQAIETAPKDGKILLLMGDTIHIGYWSDEKYAARPKPYWATVASWSGVTWMRNNQPTHWMPLAAAPAKPEGV